MINDHALNFTTLNLRINYYLLVTDFYCNTKPNIFQFIVLNRASTIFVVEFLVSEQRYAIKINIIKSLVFCLTPVTKNGGNEEIEKLT